MYVIRVGNGTKNIEGVRTEIAGYTINVGYALNKELNKNKEIQLEAVGKKAFENMMEAIDFAKKKSSFKITRFSTEKSYNDYGKVVSYFVVVERK